MTRQAPAFVLSIVLALALAIPPDAPTAINAQGTARRTLFDGARVIAGDGQPAIERAGILVENGIISRVGPRGFEVPPGTERVDLTGKTVMPGIVTLHGHVGYLKDVTFSADNYTRANLIDHLNRYLYYGVVAVMSTGTDPGDLPFQLRDEPHPGALFRTAGCGIAAPNAS